MSNKYLNNIVGNDNVEIKLNTSNIYYENKDVGENKKIIYSELSKPHLFSIEGDMDKYYKLDIDSIPSIQGNINKRDMNVVFNTISKVFDGTNNTLNLYNDFKHNDGYYFTDTSMNYIGNLLNDVSEKIQHSEILESSGNVLKNSYKLKYKLTDLNGIKVILDDYIGYSLIEENTNHAEIIFNDETFNNYKFNIKTENNETILTLVNYDLLDYSKKYTIKKEFIIYYFTKQGETIIKHIDGDLNKGEYIITSSEYNSVEASNNLIPINITGNLTGDWSNNYNVINITAFGKITKRPINIDFVLKNKIYDGTDICEIEGTPMISNYITGYVPKINYNTKGFRFDSVDIGAHNINSNFLNLYLIDNINNYNIENVTYTLKRTIRKRDIKIKFTKLIYSRTYKEILLCYEFENDIKSDNLTIDPNFQILDKNNLNILIYLNYNDNSKTDNSTLVYKLNNPGITVTSNIDKENNYDTNIDVAYSNDKKNNPNNNSNKIHEEESITKDVKVINDMIYANKSYKLQIGKPNYYEIINNPSIDLSTNMLIFKQEELGFSSQDLNYRLKNNDMVTIKNIKLNADNVKSKNYNLINSDSNITHQIKIEII